MRKGQMLDVFGMFMVLVTVALAIIAILLIYVAGVVTGNMDDKIAVERFTVRPYAVAEVLSHLRVGDRAVTEHALEIATAGGPGYTGSLGIEKSIEEFMKHLGFEDKEKYSVSVNDGSDQFVGVGSELGVLDPERSNNIIGSEAANDAYLPLLYKKDASHPSGVLGYIQIMTG